MGEAQRLRPVPPNGGPSDEKGGVRSGAPDRGGEDRLAARGHPEQSVRAQEGPADVGRTREPFPQRRLDPGELWGSSRDRDDRHTELLVQRVQVEHVEPSHDRSVHQNGANSFERPEATD